MFAFSLRNLYKVGSGRKLYTKDYITNIVFQSEIFKKKSLQEYSLHNLQNVEGIGGYKEKYANITDTKTFKRERDQ